MNSILNGATFAATFALACAVGCDRAVQSAPDAAKSEPKSAATADGKPTLEVKVTLRPATASTPEAVVVSGLKGAPWWPALRESVRMGKVLDSKGEPLLRDEVATEPGSTAQAMLGSSRVEEDAYIFEPRFPFRPGVKYRVVFNIAELPGLPADADKTVVYEYSPPAAPRGDETIVKTVYPTRDTLPENQLKFYLHFSAPMSRGEVYKRVHLLNSEGKEVDRPFLQLGEELWDDSGTRLTLLFDPGRVKRGLKPREELGPILEEGKSYTFVIDREWPDAASNPLAASFRKEFKTTPLDETQPDLETWKLAPPAAGTTDALVARFPEPFDHAMLERVVNVVDAEGKTIGGTIEIDEHETRWKFRPDANWKGGAYRIVVDTALEDLAGNSIAHPFEVDVLRPIQSDVKARTVTRQFEIRASSPANSRASN
jgi:hypothetical protein